MYQHIIKMLNDIAQLSDNTCIIDYSKVLEVCTPSELVQLDTYLSQVNQDTYNTILRANNSNGTYLAIQAKLPALQKIDNLLGGIVQ